MVLLVIGIIFVGKGTFIHAKGMVAQYLLVEAWEESRGRGRIVKPWPWADTWPVGRLRVDAQGIDLIVLEGESGEVLAFGPGHLPVSARPGGEGHCILAGHRDTSFAFLKHLSVGDRLNLEGLNGGSISYMVLSTVVKKAEDLYFETDRQGRLTLITCYPFNQLSSGGNLRYIVFAREVG